jgi:hypothetical protein
MNKLPVLISLNKLQNQSHAEENTTDAKISVTYNGSGNFRFSGRPLSSMSFHVITQKGG